MDYKLEFVCVPVSDADAAKKFYVEQAGFVADPDGNRWSVQQIITPSS